MSAKIDGVVTPARVLASNTFNDSNGTPGANVAEALDSLQANVDTAGATVMMLVNNSGAPQVAGALVKLGAVAQSFDVTATAGDPDARYVLMEDTANGAEGAVAAAGAVAVAVTGVVAVGDMLGASAMAGYAEARASGAGLGAALTANAGGLGSVLVNVQPTSALSLCTVSYSGINPMTALVFTSFAWTSQHIDTANMFDAGSPDRFSAAIDGIYQLDYMVVLYGAAFATDFAIQIAVNGIGIVTYLTPSAIAGEAMIFSIPAFYISLNAGDYVTLDYKMSGVGTFNQRGGSASMRLL